MTQEELNALKEELETLNRKLHELTDDELEQVTGGEGVPSGPVVMPEIPMGDANVTEG